MSRYELNQRARDLRPWKHRPSLFRAVSAIRHSLIGLAFVCDTSMSSTSLPYSPHIPPTAIWRRTPVKYDILVAFGDAPPASTVSLLYYVRLSASGPGHSRITRSSTVLRTAQETGSSAVFCLIVWSIGWTWTPL